ncbi:MAG: hypothetical protein QM778_07930 [Myxococcales bacterium]
MLERVRQNYGGVALDRAGAEALARSAARTSANAQAWGVMPLSDYVASVEETFQRDYTTRFRELGIAVCCEVEWPRRSRAGMCAVPGASFANLGSERSFTPYLVKGTTQL